MGKLCIICNKPVPTNNKKGVYIRRKYCSKSCNGKACWRRNRERYLIINKRASDIRRADKTYYIAELESNAKRSKQKGYDTGRMEDLAKRREEVVAECGFYKRREWEDAEIDYLENNYKKEHIYNIALRLGRSYASVNHKLSRLGFIQYNKWNKEYWSGLKTK